MSNQKNCKHNNATITIYEEVMTDYELVNGKPMIPGDEQEPEPTGQVDITCTMCGLSEKYGNWRKEAPEPIRTYIERIWNEEFGPTISSTM